MLAAVLQLVHHTAAVSYSRLRYGTCDTANRHQKFELDGARIKDVETGRCVAVQGCRLDFPYVDQGVSDPNNAFGHVVLDVCGSDACGGKSTQWKQSTPDFWESELSAGHTPAHCYGLNVVSKKDPTTNHNAAEGVWELIVWPFSPAEPCLVAADNTIFHFSAATGQLSGGNVTHLGRPISGRPRFLDWMWRCHELLRASLSVRGTVRAIKLGRVHYSAAGTLPRRVPRRWYWLQRWRSECRARTATHLLAVSWGYNHITWPGVKCVRS